MMEIISVIPAILMSGFISFWENGSCTVCDQHSNDSENILVNGQGM